VADSGGPPAHTRWAGGASPPLVLSQQDQHKSIIWIIVLWLVLLAYVTPNVMSWCHSDHFFMAILVWSV